MVDRDHGRLFVYGALLDSKLRGRLLGRELPGEAARLLGYERGQQRYFFVARRESASVPGEILSQLLPDDWAVLDQYEAVPILYTRESTEVQNARGALVRCWIYLPTGWERG
jgi:gamma-glutamylcyclotransferase (GGCT)/AIG2-like uncharacterized protein YtfP